MLSESFRNLARRSEPDVQAMRERFAAHVAGHDAVDFDAVGGRVEYRSHGRSLWRARAVLLAKLNADLKMFGWWWHGHATWSGSGPFDEIVRAGDREGVAEFHTDALPVGDEGEAFALAELAGAISEAHGVSFTRDGADLSFWALFDDAPSPSVRPPPSPTSFAPEEGAGRYSITEPPPRLAPPSSRPPTRGSRPPTPPSPPRAPRAPRMPELPVAPAPVSARPGDAPRPPPPSREAFARIADLAIAAARADQPTGVRQVLVVASVDPQGGGRRLAVHLVALAVSGKMVSVDVPRDLVNAITKLATDAAQSGATRWKRLVARIVDDERGFSFELEMR